MYIEAYQISDNEPYQPDTTITHVTSLKDTISKNVEIIIDDLCSKYKFDKEKLNQSNFESIFKNNNSEKIEYMSNLKYLIDNIELVLSIIEKENMELILTDTNSKEFGIYIKPDEEFNNKLFVHISENIIPNLYCQSTIQWIEI